MEGDQVDAAVLNFLRFGVAAIVFSSCSLSCCKLCGKHYKACVDAHDHEQEDVAAYAPSQSVLEWWGGVELGTYQFLGFALQQAGLVYTTAQRSCLLLYLNVKLVPLFAFAFHGEAVLGATWASAVLAFTGTMLLVSSGSSSTLPPNFGDVLSLMAAIASALFIFRLERLASRTSAQRLNAVSMFVVTAMFMIWMALVALSAVLATAAEDMPWWSIVQMSCRLLGQRLLAFTIDRPMTLLYLGVVTTALANWLQVVAQRSVPATSAAVIYALDPFWACLFARQLLGETLGPWGLVGCLLILVAALAQLFVRASVHMDSWRVCWRLGPALLARLVRRTWWGLRAPRCSRLCQFLPTQTGCLFDIRVATGDQN